MKKHILSLLVLFLSCASIGHAQGVGYLSRNEIYKSIPNLIRDFNTIDSLSNKYATEIKFEAAVIQEGVQKLLTSYNPGETETLDGIKKRMTPADTVTLSGFLKRNDALTKKKLSKDKELVDMQKAKIEPVLRKIEAAIKAVSEEKKLDIMFFSEEIGNSLAYVNIQKNFTKEVIAALKK